MVKAEKRSGSYSVRVSLTDPDTGERTQKRVTARTKRELDVAVSDLKTTWRTGQYIAPATESLSGYLNDWLGTLSGKPSTVLIRERHVRFHIGQDAIASVPLGRLRRSHVQTFTDRLARQHAPNTVRGIIGSLRLALRRAVMLGIIAVDPTAGVQLPARSTKRPDVLTQEQARLLVSGTRDDDWHAAWVLMVTIGLRRGEVIGLRWGDVNIEAGTLTVARTATRDSAGDWTIGDSAKTPTAHRTVRLPSVAVDALRRHRVKQVERRLSLGSAWLDSGAVFDDGTGAHHPKPGRLALAFGKALVGLDLPRITPHVLRHTAATNALQAGVPVHAVARMLGHADPAITLRTYAHVLEAMEVQSADRIDRLYGT